MIEYIKLAIIFLLRILLKLFYIFPICENRIVFISFYGKQYSCNPKYLFEYIYQNYGSLFQYVWCLNSRELFPDKYKSVKLVKYLSLGHIWYALTSKYYFDNQFFVPFFDKKKEQLFVNTWHGGGAYKKLAVNLKFYSKKRIQCMTGLLKIRAKQTSHVISSCKSFTDSIAMEWGMPKDYFLPIGMPRNDIFFSINNEKRNKILEQFEIDKKLKIVLYAPTFRGNQKNPEDTDFTLDIKMLLNVAGTKFNNDFILLYRVHSLFVFKRIPDGIINASQYPDMQELLCAADILITDYSSCIWDFSFTYNPCFIYAPDVKKYQEEQGFYTPIEEWPFPLAETNEQLVENIINFDEEKYEYAVKKHHADLGSYEIGTACEQFCRAVFSINEQSINNG